MVNHVWRSEAHNTLQEMRTVLLALKRSTRSAQGRHVRQVVITDALAALGALAKGRSSSFEALVMCRQALALAVTADVKLCLRWVQSWRNAGDWPSRGGPPGVHPETLTKTAEKLRRRGEAVPIELEQLIAAAQTKKNKKTRRGASRAKPS